jgi:LysR family transcriptional regulator, nitrogen assimilation regulatory protein
VETDRLQSFVKVVDCGSITKAAYELRITQPSLSQQVYGLEADFGEQLLLRTRLGVTPTEAGLVLYRRAQVILKEIDSAHAAVKSSRDSLSGTVSVGFPYVSVGSILAMPIVKRLRQLHPAIRLEMRDGSCSVLLDALTTGKLEIAVLGGNETALGVTRHNISEESLHYVGLASSSILVKSTPDSIGIEMLNGCPLVMPTKANSLRRIIDQAFLRTNVVPVVIAEIDSALTQLAVAKEGLAGCILPEQAVSRFIKSEPSLSSRLIEPVIRRNISICVSDSNPLSDAGIAAYRVLLECATASFPNGGTRIVAAR